MTKIVQLEVVASEAAACSVCDLYKSRNKSVFHRGSPDAQIAFVGEAPGADENETGIPFVGRAGKLLDAMIAAIGYDRDDVYVCNICKCRPPNNRKPLPTEMDACKHFLARQLDIVAPCVIIALGATAVEGLLGPGEGITKRRGKWGTYNGIQVMPTFHPSYILRNPTVKEIVRQDLKLVLEYLKKPSEK